TILHVNAPSIVGIANFTQYWSIRQDPSGSSQQDKRFQENHFAAWAAVGMPLGAFNYQIVATEGLESFVTGSLIV
ncbi:glycoside hydrolase, partial [Mycena maculata]